MWWPQLLGKSYNSDNSGGTIRAVQRPVLFLRRSVCKIFSLPSVSLSAVAPPTHPISFRIRNRAVNQKLGAETANRKPPRIRSSHRKRGCMRNCASETGTQQELDGRMGGGGGGGGWRVGRGSLDSRTEAWKWKPGWGGVRRDFGGDTGEGAP